MAIPSGLGAQWCALDETTYGVAPTLTAAPFTIFDTDSLALVKAPKESAGIYAGGLVAPAARRVITQYSVTGGAPVDVPQSGLNPWLYRMMGSFGQAKAALAQDGTTGAYSAVHALGPLAGHSFALQAGKPGIDGTVSPFTYTGMKISEWELSAAVSDIAKLQFTFQGRNELHGSWKDPLNASVPSLVSYSAPAKGVLSWVGGTLYYGGTATTSGGVTTLTSPTVAANIKGPMSFKLTRALDLARWAPDVAPFRNEPLDNGLAVPSGQFEVEWNPSFPYLAAFETDAPTSIGLQFTGPSIGTGSDFSSLEIIVPHVRLDAAPVPVSGPQVLTQVIPWTGLDDKTNNVVQATYWTLDSA